MMKTIPDLRHKRVAPRSIAALSAAALCLLLALGTSGCFDLDSALFGASTLSSYTLRTDVIPEASRTQVVLESQGKKIYGYFVKSNGALPGLTIIYSHGRRDHLQYYWDRVELLYRTGANVFVYDYQGFGMSEGTPSEAGLYSDAAAAVAYVRSRADVDKNGIVYYGYSLGCAASVHAAAYDAQPRALILEAPFASTTALAQSAFLVDVSSSFVMRGKYDNAATIRQVHAPLLVIHGENDTYIDMEQNGRVVFDNANEPKRFVPVKGANHTDIPATLGEQTYIDLLRTFMTAAAE